VGIQLKAGLRLRSVVDACEVVVVKPPGEPVDLRCGGLPFVAFDAEAGSASIEAGFDGGTQLGQVAPTTTSGSSCSAPKAGQGSISVGETVLEIKGATALLPATEAGDADLVDIADTRPTDNTRPPKVTT
jgi:hypothetical protein